MDFDLEEDEEVLSLLRLEALTKTFGAVLAVHKVSLTIQAGEFVSLLGPSGCGKTTLLRLIAGLEQPTEGKIYLEGHCINEVPAHHRQMGLVVQNYALFPHMTVFENVAYGLRVRRLKESEIRKRVLAALDLVRLPGFEHRFPRQLSGGQQQRCALARALVIHPKLLLLDEALGALDKKLREEMQVELKQLQRTVGVTAIHVTHDQEEALGMSDRIVVLNQGRIEQIDTPVNMYEHPQTEFVANFLGEANVFRARITGRTPEGQIIACSDDGYALRLEGEAVHETNGDRLIVVVRPEYATITSKQPSHKDNVFFGVIEAVVYQGNNTKVVIRLPNERRLIVYKPNLLHQAQREDSVIGDTAWITWSPSAARVVRA